MPRPSFADGIKASLPWADLLFGAIWFGSLTFYAAIVVPAGTAQVGSTTQGFITQQVTVALNVLGGLHVLIAAAATHRCGSRMLFLSWLFLAIPQTLLIALHVQLGRQLDAPTQTVPEPAKFYEWHRLYLLATTVQWLAALAHSAALIRVLARGGSSMNSANHGGVEAS